MNIKNKTILITGANRGIGRALLEEALKRGAQRVYACTRKPVAHSDERVVPLPLDVTNAVQIQGPVGNVESLDILVNNAGVDLHDDLSDRAGIERHLAVNFFGAHGVTQALPAVTSSLSGSHRQRSFRCRPWQVCRSVRHTRSRRRLRSQ